MTIYIKIKNCVEIIIEKICSYIASNKDNELSIKEIKEAVLMLSKCLELSIAIDELNSKNNVNDIQSVALLNDVFTSEDIEFINGSTAL